MDYCDIEWFALEMNRDHSVIFEIASKYCILDSFVDYDGYTISSTGFLPAVVDIMVIWVKFTHSSPFASKGLVPNWERSTSRLYIVTLLNLYAEYIMRNARLDEAQARIKFAGRNTNNLRYADDTTLMAEIEEELKSLLMKVKDESEKLA